MKFFGNRAVAIILAVLVVVVSTLVNTQMRLGDACLQVEDGFYTSSAGSKSIYARLDERIDAANGVWSILINYNAEAAGDLSGAYKALVEAHDARDIAGMYDANYALQKAFDAGVSALSSKTLTSAETDALSDYKTDFAGAQRMIDQNGYNTAVLEFYRTTLDRFPAGILAPFVGVEAPELFQ